MQFIAEKLQWQNQDKNFGNDNCKVIVEVAITVICTQTRTIRATKHMLSAIPSLASLKLHFKHDLVSCCIAPKIVPLKEKPDKPTKHKTQQLKLFKNILDGGWIIFF